MLFVSTGDKATGTVSLFFVSITILILFAIFYIHPITISPYFVIAIALISISFIFIIFMIILITIIVVTYDLNVIVCNSLRETLLLD